MKSFDSWCRTIQNEASTEMWGLCCFWGDERTRLFHSAVYVLGVLTWLFTTRGTHGLLIT